MKQTVKRILSIDSQNHYIFTDDQKQDKNLKITNLNYNDIENIKKDMYDFIIIYDLFSQHDSLIDACLTKCKDILNIGGYIIFINVIITNYFQYTYHPLSYIQSYIFGKSISFSILDDTIRKFGYSIKNIDRLYNINIPTYPIEIFCLLIS